MVPRATSSSGMASPMVSPQRPGRRTLPSSSAESTVVQEPPVAHSTSAATSRATAILVR